MHWTDEVNTRLKIGNHVLLSKESIFLHDLLLAFSEQNHRVLVLWAFDCAEETVNLLERKYQNDKRPIETLEAAKDWAFGRIKMREAQRKSLDCHAAAKEITCKEDIPLFHAVGQADSKTCSRISNVWAHSHCKKAWYRKPH